MKRLLALLLWALPLAAQTPVTVQNANFQTAVTFTASDAAGDQWVPNAVPGWTIGPGGSPGHYTGIAQYPSLCGANAPQMMYMSAAPVTQDVGPQQAGTYALTVNLCNRADGSGANATYTLSLGGCTQSGALSTIPQGTTGSASLSCPIANPSGDAVISLGCSGGQCNFASVALTFTPAGPPPPLIYPLPGLGTASFTMAIPPSCGPSDGVCSIQIQIVMPSSVTCSADSNGNITCIGQAGALSLIKTSSLPAPQVLTVPVVMVTPQ